MTPAPSYFEWAEGRPQSAPPVRPQDVIEITPDDFSDTGITIEFNALPEEEIHKLFKETR